MISFRYTKLLTPGYPQPTFNAGLESAFRFSIMYIWGGKYELFMYQNTGNSSPLQFLKFLNNSTSLGNKIALPPGHPLVKFSRRFQICSQISDRIIPGGVMHVLSIPEVKRRLRHLWSISENHCSPANKERELGLDRHQTC